MRVREKHTQSIRREAEKRVKKNARKIELLSSRPLINKTVYSVNVPFLEFAKMLSIEETIELMARLLRQINDDEQKIRDDNVNESEKELARERIAYCMAIYSVLMSDLNNPNMQNMFTP